MNKTRTPSQNKIEVVNVSAICNDIPASAIYKYN